MSVSKQAGKGFISYLLRNVLEKLMGLVALIFLARRLSPYDFGLVSITEVLLSLISVLGTTGLSEFLLAYRKDDIDEIFKSAFWFNIVLTLSILLVFLIVVPFWASWQKDARIQNIGWIVGAIFVFSQLQIIPKTWLSKNLMFEKQVKIQAPFIIIVPLAKIAAVFAGFGVYSLILPTLIIQPVLTLLLYSKTSIRPTLHLFTSRWKEIYHFTKHLIGATIFTRITDQGDKLIVAKVLGLDKLGVYNIAVQLADLFTSQLVQVSNSVLSSILPKYVDDKEKFYKYYINFLKTFSFFIFPMLAIMFIAAKPLILLLYGTKWVGAVLPLQILCIATAFRAVSSSYGCVMNSFHQNKKSFIVTVVYGPFHLIASGIGSMFGIAGLALAVTLIKLVFINWNIKQVMDTVAKPFINWYKEMIVFFVANAIIAVLLYTISRTVDVYEKPAIEIAIISVAYFILYIVLFKTVFKNKVREVGFVMQTTFPKSSYYFNRLFGL